MLYNQRSQPTKVPEQQCWDPVARVLKMLDSNTRRDGLPNSTARTLLHSAKRASLVSHVKP